ncbi:hypothetical protein [Actinoallomurus acaciae]|uniref:hypothetical protein n=1 Tax=Actinoallomurus acaciae TaxID=502577 RepID=UPI00406BA5E4
MHAALRQVLGPAALQSGSYNRPGYLRLDFSWQGALSEQARDDVEEAANRTIRRDLPVQVRYMPLTAAREIGALALFGETYDENVRVVEIGGAWSRELCGGTHVDHAAQIGPIALTGESSVGSGRRRVEAVTGIEAFHHLARERDLVARLAEQLHAPREELPGRVAGLIERMKQAERESERLRDRLIDTEAQRLAARPTVIGDIAYVGVRAEDHARRTAELVRDHLDTGRPGVVTVVTPASLVTATNEAARARGLSAGELVKAALEGHGGGNATLARGKAPADGTAALDLVARLLRTAG